MKPLSAIPTPFKAVSTMARGCSLAIVGLVSAHAAQAGGLSSPNGLAFDGSGLLWVANYGSNQVQAWNVATTPFMDRAITDGVSGPTRLAFDRNGSLYVANTVGNTVTVYDAADGRLTGTITTGLSNPLGVAVDGSLNVYVANNGANNVTVYNSSLSLLATVAGDNKSGFDAPGAIAVRGPFLYLGLGPGGSPDTVRRYSLATFTTGTPSANFVVTSLNRPTGPAGPTGIAFEGNTMLVANLYSGNVGVYPLTGSNHYGKPITADIGFTEGVAVDKAGDIYASDYAASTISVYDSSGAFLYKF